MKNTQEIDQAIVYFNERMAKRKLEEEITAKAEAESKQQAYLKRTGRNS